MTEKQYIMVIATPLVIIMTIVTILSSGFLATTEDRVDNIKIEITYSGSWEAMRYNNEEIQSLTCFT